MVSYPGPLRPWLATIPNTGEGPAFLIPMASEQTVPDPTTSTPSIPLTARLSSAFSDARANTRWWEVVGYVTLVVIGLMMRLWDLGARAMHHDESLHALYSWKLSNGEGFAHNPMMHGPLQFEVNAALFFVLGDSDLTARILYAFMGTALILTPFLFRSRLGRLGALFAALMLTVSPAMLYYSRFARNDILMAVWTFGIVICMWRYFDEGRNRYLYISAALLALMFATKESAYMVVAMMGLWSFLMAMQPSLSRTWATMEIQGVSPPVALSRLVDSVWSAFLDVLDESRRGGPAAFMVFLIVVTLPMWSAFAALFQETPLLSWLNLTLAAGEGSPRIGDPLGGGNVIAFVIVVGMIALSAYFGYRWNLWLWLGCANIFYIIWILLYTTFLTNFAGVKSGIWQALGYWIVQQEEGRGSQPWYYYFLITSVYEFLPLLLGTIAAIYYLRKRETFGVFLAFWALTTFLLYTIASEKMPWLLVNIALPFIIMTGKFLAELAHKVEWRKFMREGRFLLILGVPVFMALLWSLAVYSPTGSASRDILLQAVAALALLGMFGVGVYMYRGIGHVQFLSISALGLATLLLVLSMRSGVIAAYQNGDTPVEMIVYTQTSPDVTRLLDTFDETGAGSEMPVEIDATSGFSWPWAWYFRDADNVQYPVHNEKSFNSSLDDSVLVVHSTNQSWADTGLGEAYLDGKRIRHRWWFPEHTYRSLTPGKLVSGLLDRSAWRGAMNYWLNREGVYDILGSEDSYVYFNANVPQYYRGAP